MVSVRATLCPALLTLLCGMALAGEYQPTPAELRVGKTYWARPGINETSVDFYKEAELRTRLPVYHKTRFEILGVTFADGFPEPAILYKVRLESGDEGYIGLASFEQGLYAELGPNEVMSSQFIPPLGVGLHVYIFERKSIFAADPDLIWERIKNDGPTFFIRPPPGDGANLSPSQKPQ